MTDERQGGENKGGEKGGMMVSDRVGENEGKRKKGESLRGEGSVIKRNGVGGGCRQGGWQGGRKIL